MKFCNVFYFLFLWDWAVTDDPIPESRFSILKGTTSASRNIDDVMMSMCKESNKN